jgi:hypothetical protein
MPTSHIYSPLPLFPRHHALVSAPLVFPPSTTSPFWPPSVYPATCNQTDIGFRDYSQRPIDASGLPLSSASLPPSTSQHPTWSNTFASSFLARPTDELMDLDVDGPLERTAESLSVSVSGSSIAPPISDGESEGSLKAVDEDEEETREVQSARRRTIRRQRCDLKKSSHEKG